MQCKTKKTEKYFIRLYLFNSLVYCSLTHILLVRYRRTRSRHQQSETAIARASVALLTVPEGDAGGLQRNNIAEIRSHMGDMKLDMADVKADMAEMKRDMAEMLAFLQTIKEL